MQYVAIEKLLRLKYAVRLPASSLELGKRAPVKIQTLKKKLAARGYYRDAPFDIRPLPERLNRADVPSAMERFAAKLSAYQEPQRSRVAAEPPPRISTKDRIFAWLRQFDNEDHVNCALQLLENFRMLGRSETVDALKAFIDKNPLFRGGVVVPFGDAKDSGAVQTYFSADLTGSYISGCRSLDDCVRVSPSTPIIFLDDFIGSGGQAQDILAAGFGVTSLRKALGEERDMFASSIQEHLRKCPLAFVFTAAWDEGITNMKKTLQKISLNATVFHHIREEEIPFAFDNCLKDVDQEVIDSFRARCEEIGSGIVATMIDSEAEEKGTKTKGSARKRKIAERSLGYGNRAMLLGTPINVPTQTITLLWGEGKVDGGVEWTPLMPRRRKI